MILCHTHLLLRRSDGLEALQEDQMTKKMKTGGKDAAEGAEGGPAKKHYLNWTVHLLANCAKDDLEHLEKAQGVQRCVAVYRLVPCQILCQIHGNSSKQLQ